MPPHRAHCVGSTDFNYSIGPPGQLRTRRYSSLLGGLNARRRTIAGEDRAPYQRAIGVAGRPAPARSEQRGLS